MIKSGIRAEKEQTLAEKNKSKLLHLRSTGYLSEPASYPLKRGCRVQLTRISVGDLKIVFYFSNIIYLSSFLVLNCYKCGHSDFYGIGDFVLEIDSRLIV